MPSNASREKRASGDVFIGTGLLANTPEQRSWYEFGRARVHRGTRDCKVLILRLRSCRYVRHVNVHSTRLASSMASRTRLYWDCSDDVFKALFDEEIYDSFKAVEVLVGRSYGPGRSNGIR